MTRNYELIILVTGSSTPEQIKAVNAALKKIVTAHKGKIEKEESMGKKFLAYKIAKQTEALFLRYELSLDASEAQAVEKEVRQLDEVMRSLFVLSEE